MRILICLLFNFFFSTILVGQDKHLLEKLFKKKGSPTLQRILKDPATYQYQIIYTEINRDKNNKPSFKYHFLNVDKDRYFYPASTVKLPAALLALEKLNKLSIPQLDKHTAMFTDSAYSGQTKVLADTSSKNGLPSVANYIKKIFLVSDNDAYNRLYEFGGQQYINHQLWDKGYDEVRIVKRFVPMFELENLHTNPISFYDGDKLIYEQKQQNALLDFDYIKIAKVGKGYIKEGKLVNEPMDFTRHNRFTLEDQQQMLQSIMFPGSSSKKDFNLSADDYQFLYNYMSMLPPKSNYPTYDSNAFYDNYAKCFLYGLQKTKVPDYIKIYNKAGWAYGFLTDNCYVQDYKNKVEFMIAAVIYTNKDEILNDDKYDYLEIGDPFFKEVGQIIYQYELDRKRKHQPIF